MHALKLADFMLFLSTLSLRRATAVTTVVVGPSRDFYPRSPCGERRGNDLGGRVSQEFLSTLSLRRATRGKVTDGYDRSDFYPRSPCGERRQKLAEAIKPS